ncbi:MAG: FAD-dependent oxidoreductase [Actinobacteria bacterium]|nr:FAD-dependent oxidoreductase [Actinomycetota bacterium]
MRVAIIGAGAWGLPTGAELAARGHDVTVLDAFGVANPASSSSGPTRIWRLAHMERADVRLQQESVRAWADVERRVGRPLRTTCGLLWRDRRADRLAASVAAEGVEHTWVDAADVGRFFPGLRPDGVDAVWQPEAGVVLAADSLVAHAGLLADAGGRLSTGSWVRAVDPGPDGVRLTLGEVRPGAAGATTGTLDVDAVVVTAGPWAQPLLDALGVGVRVLPALGQVTHVTGRPDAEALPCLLDGYQDPADGGDSGGVYAMPTPGLGYKLGFGAALRPFDPADTDRTPSDDERARMLRYVEGLGFDAPVAGPSQVCTWTDSPDGDFVMDTVADGCVVVATGDTGHGFKFSAVAGRWLADLVEGRDVGPDVDRFRLARFAG